VAEDRVERSVARTLGRIALVLAVLAGLATWEAMTGFYTLDPGEAAVILRLGRYSRTVGAEGVHFHLPWPLETRDVVHTGESKQREFGDVASSDPEVVAETTMQTGDNNIVLVEFVVQYRVGNPFEQLYRVSEGDALLVEAAQAAMREVIGRHTIDELRERKVPADAEAEELLQRLLDSYEAGIVVENVGLQKSEPPLAVQQAFADVNAASQDRDRQVSEAQAYANEKLPQARAEASELRAEAESYEQARVAEATGEAQRFRAIVAEYQKAPAITRKRMYLETMEAVLPDAQKWIVAPGTATVVPYLPLPGARATGKD
jgi:membrane protease subunit HflK